MKLFTKNHINQLLNYLLLTGTQHGKLLNFRPAQLEHEFVNTSLKQSDRRCFSVDDSRWQATDGFGLEKKDLIEEMVKDWGTGLSRNLYEEGLTHFFSKEKKEIFCPVDVFFNEEPIAKQVVPLCADEIMFRITSFEKVAKGYRQSLASFLKCVDLDAIHWINIDRKRITFETFTL